MEFPSSTDTYPMEMWFYAGDPAKLLPPHFYLLFFQRFGAGDFALYNPVSDGIHALMPSVNRQIPEIEVLRRMDPELARAAINYLPSAAAIYTDQPSLESLTVLHKIDRAKEVGVDTTYAQQVLVGSEEIVTSYTFVIVDYPHSAFGSSNELNLNFIDFYMSIPPEDIDFGSYKDNVYGAFKLEYRLAGSGGEILYSETDSQDLDYTMDQYEFIKTRPLLFVKRLPAVAGTFNLSVTFTNEIVKERFTLSRNVEVPEAAGTALSCGDILLARGMNQLSDAELTKVRPLQFADVVLVPSPDQTFTSSMTLYAYLQFLKPGGFPAGRQEVTVAYDIIGEGGEEVESGERLISPELFSQNGLFHFFVRWPLEAFAAGDYTLMLRISAPGESRVIVRNTNFTVSPEKFEPVLIVGGQAIDLQSPEYLRSMSMIQRSLGNLESAEMFLRAAVANAPDNVECISDLAEVLVETGKFDDAMKVCQAMLAEEPDNISFLRAGARAYLGLKEPGKAAKLLARLIAAEGATVSSLNLIGRAYYDSGKIDEAREAWRLSLDIDPAQEDIKKLLEESGDSPQQNP
jgi:tetratricopeptide (TPR) repeat protein